MPSVVCKYWPGIALSSLPPGTAVRITVIGLPTWADTWPELDDIVGNTAVAFVADRPGEDWYADAWPVVFKALSGDRLWVGRLYVSIQLWEDDATRDLRNGRPMRRGVVGARRGRRWKAR